MTRIDLRLTVLCVAALLGACMPALSAHAGDNSLTNNTFKDLPGVKKPEKDDQQARTVCTSSIEKQRPTRGRNGLGYRVYHCETELFSVESNQAPNEIDWRKRKNYYKPWIKDGF